MAGLITAVIVGLYWRRATKAGAIASMALGLIGAGVFGYYHQFVAKLPMHFSFYALILSVVAMVVVSLLTKKNSESTLDATMTGLYIQPK